MNTRRLLIATACALAIAISLYFVTRGVYSPHRSTSTAVAHAPKIAAFTRALRPNYPYSVIPGGAYSPAELRYSIEHDSLVREHYTDFDMKSARLFTVTQDRFQYASFRLKNAIFWTRHPLRIPKGEMLLTDGRNYARARCGNRLSTTAMPNTTLEEPSPKSLSLPPIQAEMLAKAEIQLAEAPPLEELAQTYPALPFEPLNLPPFVPPHMDAVIEPGFWGPLAGWYMPGVSIAPRHAPPSTLVPPDTSTPPSDTPPETPVPRIVSEVPEPASLYLFGVTFCISLWFLTRMMRKSPDGQDATRDEN